jgi:ABC-type sulfate/molybdate transport systems ATPase subunit
MEVADRVVLMNHGAIEQVGSPDEVCDHPATDFVRQFLSDLAPPCECGRRPAFRTYSSGTTAR